MAARATWTAVVACAASSALAQPAPQPLDRRLNATIEREQAAGRFDGVVLVGRSDAVVYQRAIGFADRARRQPHRVDQPWRPASVSKQAAALLVMQQVERRRLTLETPLAELLPDFQSPPSARITVRQLLQHTSGLPNPDATLSVDAEPFFNLLSFGASGALIGSAGDLWRFDQALMQRRLLGDASTRVMWTGDPKIGHAALGACSFTAPFTGCGVDRFEQHGADVVRRDLAKVRVDA